jgi:hypothetical protein
VIRKIAAIWAAGMLYMSVPALAQEADEPGLDPVNDLAVVFATQKSPFDGSLHHDIRDAVYGEDYLGPPGDQPNQ